MQFDTNTPRGNHVLHGVPVTLPHVFTVGDVLSAEHAAYLNKAIAIAVLNGAGSAAKRAADDENTKRKDKKHPQHGVEAKVTDFIGQDTLDARFADYSLSGSNRGAGVTHDPVTKFAQSIAGEKIKELYRAKGFKFRTMQTTEHPEHGNMFNAHVAAFIERNPWVREEAQRQVDNMKAHAADIDLGEPPAEAPKAA
jgi:hypothetical protein